MTFLTNIKNCNNVKKLWKKLFFSTKNCFFRLFLAKYCLQNEKFSRKIFKTFKNIQKCRKFTNNCGKFEKNRCCLGFCAVSKGLNRSNLNCNCYLKIKLLENIVFSGWAWVVVKSNASIWFSGTECQRCVWQRSSKGLQHPNLPPLLLPHVNGLKSAFVEAHFVDNSTITVDLWPLNSATVFQQSR